MVMARRIPLSHRAHITGWHPVYPGHGAVPFESALERDAITWLTQWCGFRRVVAQALTVEYLRADGSRGHYTPDLRVTFEPLPVELQALGFSAETYIEVKYADEAERLADHLDRVGNAVRQQTARPWIVLTEREVRRVGRPRLDGSPWP